MKFIVIIIGILLLRHMGTLSRLQRDGWYHQWVTFVNKKQWFESKPAIGLLVSLILPLFVLIALLLLMDNHWFGIPVFMLSFLVFLYSLGRGNLEEEIDGYRDDLRRDDLQAAYHDAAEFNVTKKVGTSESWSELHEEVIGALSYRYFERYFAVIFWFVLAGAPGALLYRLLALHSEMKVTVENKQVENHELEMSSAQHGLHIMEWLPVRLMGLSLAFVGNFTACLDSLRASLLSGSISTLAVMRNYVLAALASGSTSVVSQVIKEEKVGESLSIKQGAETEVAEIRALFSRALMLALCLVAFLVILL